MRLILLAAALVCIAADAAAQEPAVPVAGQVLCRGGKAVGLVVAVPAPVMGIITFNFPPTSCDNQADTPAKQEPAKKPATPARQA